MTELIKAVARNLHGELSRIDVIRYLEMPDNTAERLTTAALTAITDAGYRIVKDKPVAWMQCSEWHDRVPLYAAPGDEK